MNRIEIINNIFPLLETIEEAAIHLKKQILELRWEESMNLIEDLLLGVSAIQESVEIMVQKSKFNIDIKLINNIKNAASKLLEVYKKGNYKKYSLCIENELVPAFIIWKNEVEKSLKLYRIS